MCWLDDDDDAPKKKGAKKVVAPVPPVKGKGKAVIVPVTKTSTKPAKVEPEEIVEPNLLGEKAPIKKNFADEHYQWRFPYLKGMMNVSATEKEYYLREHWEVYNKTRFGSKLKHPASFNVVNNKSRYGTWNTGTRVFTFSEWVFQAKISDFIDETILHEMAHQYVSEVLGDQRDSHAHGPKWRATMLHIGLKPDAKGHDNMGNFDVLDYGDGKVETRKDPLQEAFEEFKAKHARVTVFVKYKPIYAVYSKNKAIDLKIAVLMGRTRKAVNAFDIATQGQNNMWGANILHANYAYEITDPVIRAQAVADFDAFRKKFPQNILFYQVPANRMNTKID